MEKTSSGTYTVTRSDSSKMDIFFENGKKVITVKDSDGKNVTFKVNRNNENYTFTADKEFSGKIMLKLQNSSNADDNSTANFIYYSSSRQSMADLDGSSSDMYASFKIKSDDEYGYVLIDKKYQKEDGSRIFEEKAEFRIWSSDYETYEKSPDSMKDTLMTTTSGKTGISKKLPIGTYYIEQSAAPSEIPVEAWLRKTTFEVTAGTAAKPTELVYVDKIIGTPEIKLPQFSLDVSKVDKYPGNDKTVNSTGRGDSPLDSGITVTITPDKGAGDGTVIQLDIFGKNGTPYVFKPWKDESNLSKIEDTYTDGGGVSHTKVTYTASAIVTSTETKVPEGRFDEPGGGTGTGKRMHTLEYYAESIDGFPFTYKITYDGKETADFEETVPLEINADVYVNEVFKGQLQIIKTKSDENPFTNNGNGVIGSEGSSSNTGGGSPMVSPGKYASDTEFTVRLAGSGYEGNPYINCVKVNRGEPDYDEYANVYRVTNDGNGVFADKDNPLKTSDYGQIKVLGLPYGEYTVEELKADAYGYVLESENIKISYDGQKISTSLNNIPKKNRIKVTKVNAETDKMVYLKGTKFRLKYLGNPDLTDPTSSKNYGRYMPNGSNANDGSNYVFECDENGYIVLPYEIEYGNYQLEELIVPEGYYVGSYDKDGNGTSVDMDKTFEETVVIFDETGKKVEDFKTEGVIYNGYKFTVTEQDRHIDGSDYITYYFELNIKNNPVKGQIEVNKEGDLFAGWVKSMSNGYNLYESTWTKHKLSKVEFMVYAADDVVQSDGVIPIKVYNRNGKQIELPVVSREPSSAGDITEIARKILDSGEIITQTREKNKSDKNRTLTEYTVKSLSGASYEETFEKKESGSTYRYEVLYKLNYAKGGMNYTDVHVKKTSVSDEYTDSIATTQPKLTTDGKEILLDSIKMPNKNTVNLNTPIVEEYTTDDITAGAVAKSDTYTDGADPLAPENKGKIKEPVIPTGWTLTTKSDMFVISKDDTGTTSFETYVKDGDDYKWVRSNENGVFYKSFVQEYNFTMVQHFDEEAGFVFEWDELKVDTAANNKEHSAVTTVTGNDSEKAYIREAEVYSHKTSGKETEFTAKPSEGAAVYFMTNDGIKTNMYFSGGQVFTTVTVTQSQLKNFKNVFPAVSWNGKNIDWNKKLSPSNEKFEYLVNNKNYIKAERHEVSPTNSEVYYTVDIVTDSNQMQAADGLVFTVIYPDTTQMTPVIDSNGAAASGKLSFTSLDETMMFPMGTPVTTITTDDEGKAYTGNLPLGTYYVYEVDSVTGYVNAGEWQKFTLEYKDQYTPLVWTEGKFDNEAVSVKIDLKKLGETAVGSREYEILNGAIFGIYTAEEISSSSPKEGAEKSALPDTLVGVFVTSGDGIGTVTAKLPMGKYYVKELAAPSGYKINPFKFFFDVKDVLLSDTVDFEYKEEGMSGSITSDGNGNAVIDIKALEQTPMQIITVNGKTYALDKDAKDDIVKNTVRKGQSETIITVKKEETIKVTIGSDITINVSSYGEEYTAVFDGKVPTELKGDGSNIIRRVTGTATTFEYSPKVTFTNWSSEATYKYNEIKNTSEEQKAKITELVLTVPDKTSNITGKLSEDGSKMDIEITDTVTSIMINDEIKPASQAFTLNKGDIAVINLSTGITFTASLSNERNVILTAAGNGSGNIDGESTFAVDGNSHIQNIKNANLKNTTAKTYARNNTWAGVLNVTINSVKNDKTPDTWTPPAIPVSDSPKLEITKTDMETGRTLPGAKFEIWSSKIEEGEVVKDKVIYKGTTGSDGKMVIDVEADTTYFYHEAKAPEGYIADSEYYCVDIAKGVLLTKVTMTNEKVIKKNNIEVNDEEKVREEGHMFVKEESGNRPRTGDSNMLTVYMLIFLALSVVIICIAKIRKEKNNWQ